MSFGYTTSSASTGERFTATTVADSRFTAIGDAVVKRGAKRPSAMVQNAVYAHIKAVRTLGRTTINVSEIARSLALPIKDVTRAVSALRSKGVKVVE